MVMSLANLEFEIVDKSDALQIDCPKDRTLRLLD